jgi:biopolymer transport protein TolQ
MGRYFSILGSSGLFAKIILLALFCISVASWAIIVWKLLALKRAQAQDQRFRRVFSRNPGQSFLDRRDILENLPSSPLASVGRRTVEELTELEESSMGRPRIGRVWLENLESSFERQISRIEDSFLSYVPFLGTVSSVSPFLGLLGTVWGVMKAFMDIRLQGTAHISVVAPGIADALITTVAGLLVAIPALVAHNYFVSRVGTLTSEMERLARKTVENLRRQYHEEI